MPGFNIGVGCSDGSPSNTLETGRKNRFILKMLDPLTSDITIVAHKCTRPTPEFSVVTMHNGQDEITNPGKNRWAPITISFYEVVNSIGTNDTAFQIYKWWSEGILDLSKSRLLKTFKKTCILQMIDGAGAAIWEYKIYGAWISKVSPDDLDTSESAVSEITLTLNIDKAEEVQRKAGVFETTTSCGEVQPQFGFEPDLPVKSKVPGVRIGTAFSADAPVVGSPESGGSAHTPAEPGE